MKKIKLLSAYVLVVCLSCLPILAEENSPAEKTERDSAAYTTDEIVISAKGYKKAITKTPGGINVIQEKELREKVPASISNSLDSVPGVNKNSDSAWGSSINIRGVSRDKVIFLIDGSRVNTATDVNAQFGTIDPFSIERIEILKGPISSLYGSGSIGGVVNVITRNGKFKDRADGDTGVSASFNTSSEGINSYAFISYNSADFYSFASGSFRKHSTYEDGAGHEMANSGFKDAQGTLNLGYRIGEEHTIEIKTQYYQGMDVGIPAGADAGFPATAKVVYPDIRRALASVDYTLKPEADLWDESKLHIYWQFIDRNVEVTDLPAATNLASIEPEADHHTIGGKWTNIFKFSKNTLVAGIDSWARIISSERKKTSTDGDYQEDTPLPDASYISNGIFAEDDFDLNRYLTFNLGARFDLINIKNDETFECEKPFSSPLQESLDPDRVIWEEDDKTEYSYNLHAGVTYNVNEKISTSLLAAKGYRAASLEERYKYIFVNPTLERWGNPDLDPEESLFFEYSFHLKWKPVNVSLSAYYNSIDNLIAEKTISSSEKRLENIEKARIYGGEIDLTVFIIDGLSLRSAFSYTRGRDTENDEDLASVAPWNIYTKLSYESPFGLSCFVDTVYTAKQNNVPSGTEESDDWTRVDAGVSYSFVLAGIKSELFVNCSNILDAEYNDYLTTSRGYTFNEPGRTFKFGMTVEY